MTEFYDLLESFDAEQRSSLNDDVVSIRFEIFQDEIYTEHDWEDYSWDNSN
jgi:hypothetical protein